MAHHVDVVAFHFMWVLYDWDGNPRSTLLLLPVCIQAKHGVTFYWGLGPPIQCSVLLTIGGWNQDLDRANTRWKMWISSCCSLSLLARPRSLYLLDVEGAQSTDFEIAEIENSLDSLLRDCVSLGLIFLCKLELEIHTCTLSCILFGGYILWMLLISSIHRIQDVTYKIVNYFNN